jgi:hypothetical protein
MGCKRERPLTAIIRISLNYSTFSYLLTGNQFTSPGPVSGNATIKATFVSVFATIEYDNPLESLL